VCIKYINYFFLSATTLPIIPSLPYTGAPRGPAEAVCAEGERGRACCSVSTGWVGGTRRRWLRGQTLQSCE